MPIIDADGCPIHVEVEGPEQAPVLMLSNSLGTTLHMWDEPGRPIHQALPSGAIRPARPRPIGRAEGALYHGAARPRRACRARRARDREDQLVRPLHGRHGRPVAGRERAGAGRAARPHQHVQLFPRQEHVERPHRSRAGKGPRLPSRRRTWSAGSPRRFGNVRRTSLRARKTCSPRPRWKAISAAQRAVRDMDHRELLPKISRPYPGHRRKARPGNAARGERVHQQAHSRRKVHTARCRAPVECRAAARPTPTRCWDFCSPNEGLQGRRSGRSRPFGARNHAAAAAGKPADIGGDWAACASSRCLSITITIMALESSRNWVACSRTRVGIAAAESRPCP